MLVNVFENVIGKQSFKEMNSNETQKSQQVARSEFSFTLLH